MSRSPAPDRRPTRAGRCPSCGRPSHGATRPFCSRRCQEADLGRWLDGAYRIPTEEAPGAAEHDPDESESADAPRAAPRRLQ